MSAQPVNTSVTCRPTSGWSGPLKSAAAQPQSVRQVRRVASFWQILEGSVSPQNHVITIAIITVLSVSLSAFPFENRLSSNGQQADVKLIAKYRQTTLFDVSSDGHLILLYGASTPRKDVKSGGMSQWEPKRGETYFDLLRVVEWESGRELSSIHVHKVPSAARFVEGATQICYRAQKDNNLWDYVSGHQSVCPNEPQNGAYRGSCPASTIFPYDDN